MSKTQATQMYANIDQIKPKTNPRKDLGDLSELAASIKEHGVIQPIIVISRKEGYELVAGERRLHAAKAAGMKQIPIRPISADDFDDDDVAAVKIIENIHRKDLTLLEEGVAYDAYIKRTKKTAADLAKALGTTRQYVERRAVLVNLTREARVSLEMGKFKLGHAIILAQMTHKQQDEVLANIDWENTSVEEFAQIVRWNEKIDWSKAVENASLPRGKEGKQTFLQDAFGELAHPHQGIQGLESFKKDFSHYVSERKERLREKGIILYETQDALLKAYPGAVSVQSWNPEYGKIVNALSKSTEYAVVVDVDEDGDVETIVYQLVPKREKKGRAAEGGTNEEETEALELSKKERLQRKIDAYKHSWQVTQIRERLKNKSTIKIRNSLVLSAAGSPTAAKSLLQLPIQEQANAFLEIATERIANIPANEVGLYADAIGVNPEKDFELNEDYLLLYTKEELLVLAKELKIPLKDGPKQEMVYAMITAWIALPGVKNVPKAFMKKSR